MIPAQELISPILSMDAQLVAGSDNSFAIYIHQRAGATPVATGTTIPQIITTLSPSISLLEHANDQFQRISDAVDLTFMTVADPSQADISFYVDTEIELGDPNSVTFGLTVTNIDNLTGRRWFEIFLNGPAMHSRNSSLEAYVFNHELLHALGLEHTFDDSDGDFYLSTDPQLSATPEETVMSYRSPASGIYPDDIRPSDYNALQQIWGFPRSNIINSNISEETSVFRLYQPETGKHIFTTSQQEIDLLTGSELMPFVNEGVAYRVDSAASQDLYRFYNPVTGKHLYSANSSERDILIARSDSSYIFEGVAYKVYASTSAPSSATSVVRYFDPSSGSHFYTSNSEEQSILQVTHPHWIKEGIAWYV